MSKQRTFWIAVAAAWSAAAVSQASTVTLGRVSNPLPNRVEPFGARAAAMGFAFTAVGEGPEAVGWNAAGLTGLTAPEVGMFHRDMLLGAFEETFSLGTPLGQAGAMGVSGSLAKLASIERRDANGVYLGEAFPSDYKISAAYAHRFNRFALGVGLGSVEQDLIVGYHRIWATDISVAWNPLRHLRLAGVAKATVSGDAVYQPYVFGQMGVSFRHATVYGSQLYSVETVLEPAGESELRLGMESSFAGQFFARAGYRFLFPDPGQGALRGLTVGGGFRVAGLILDYAWLPQGALGNLQRISLSYRFSSAPSAMPQEKPLANPMVPSATQTPVEPSARRAPASPPQETARPASSASRPADSLAYNVVSEGYAQGMDLLAAGKDAEAVKAWIEAVGKDPRDLHSWRALARLYERRGRVDYARRCWEAVRRLDPQNEQALRWLRDHPPN